MRFFTWIASTAWSIFHRPLSNTQMANIFDGIATLPDFAEYLKNNGFKYQLYMGENMTEKTDDFLRPNLILSTKEGNCSDFMRLFETFCKYKQSKHIKVADGYVQYELISGSQWHYISIINFNDAIYIQSNISLTQGYTDYGKTVLDSYKKAGWEVKREVERWQYSN